MTETILIQAEPLRQFCSAAFERAGLSAADAGAVADTLVEADLRGVHSHGVWWTLTYTQRLRQGGVNPCPNIRVLRETPAMALLDADRGLGQIVGVAAMRRAIDMAKGCGVGMVTVRNSNHFGAAAYYALMAAQAEQIGIAETDWYPAISITGQLGWQAQNLSDLFRPQSLNSNVGPSFQWNLLNYGRILNNVRLQDAQFRQLVTAYQSLVLQADLEVENGIVTFVQAQQRADDLRKSVDDAWLALQVIVAQYQAGLGGIDFNRYATIQQNLIVQQDQWAQSRGQISLGLIQVYRGLGGGWQIKCSCPPDKQGVLSPAVASVDQPAPAADPVKPLSEVLPPPSAL